MAVTKSPQRSISTLHKHWAELEDEHHTLAAVIAQAGIVGSDLTSMRKRQASLILKIASVVAEIQDAPGTTIEDFVALLDVALEHELDLAGDIAFYGPADYPMICRLLRSLASMVPGFEFNSLRRWLSLPGQFEQLMGRSPPFEPAADETRPTKRNGAQRRGRIAQPAPSRS
jgi:hypothetical protein